MRYPFKALELDIGEDLLPLSSILHQRGVDHRIFEEKGLQVLMVAREEQLEEVASLYQGWRSGQFRIERVERVHKEKASGGQRVSTLKAPVTIILIALSILGFGLVYLRAPLDILGLFTFTPVASVRGQLQFEVISGQYWRYLTPVFLHFGWLHIAFNSLWLWELGGKVERVLGSVNMFFLFCTIALVSNVAQYVFGGPGLFGGMSGVVYGLLGFCWVGSVIQPAWQFRPPKPVMIMMVGWLLFCMAGIVEVLGFGAIANAAHLGGLLVGAALGAAFGLLSRFSHDKA